MIPFNRLSTSWRAQRSRRGLPGAALAVSCLLFASCAVGPDYKRPAVAAPVDYKEGPAVETPVLASDWWTLFGD